MADVQETGHVGRHSSASLVGGDPRLGGVSPSQAAQKLMAVRGPERF